MKKYIVTLCFGREKCERETAELARRNCADDYVIEPVKAPFHSREPGWLGSLLFKDEED